MPERRRPKGQAVKPERREGPDAESVHYPNLAFKPLPEYDNNRMQMLGLELLNSGQHRQSRG